MTGLLWPGLASIFEFTFSQSKGIFVYYILREGRENPPADTFIVTNFLSLITFSKANSWEELSNPTFLHFLS